MDVGVGEGRNGRGTRKVHGLDPSGKRGSCREGLDDATVSIHADRRIRFALPGESVDAATKDPLDSHRVSLLQLLRKSKFNQARFLVSVRDQTTPFERVFLVDDASPMNYVVDHGFVESVSLPSFLRG
jgi:hypothetical protein